MANLLSSMYKLAAPVKWSTSFTGQADTPRYDLPDLPQLNNLKGTRFNGARRGTRRHTPEEYAEHSTGQAQTFSSADVAEENMSSLTGKEELNAYRHAGVGTKAALSPPVNSTGQEDEVIVSALTFIGGVTPILFQGATPIFIDCDRSSWNVNADLLTEELESCKRRGNLPKAVPLLCTFGQRCHI